MAEELLLKGPHWTFALDLYRQPSVATACLSLQDRLGVDVNILLFSLFAAKRRSIVLDRSDIESLDRTVAEWREETVLKLRAIRRRLKLGPAPAPQPATEVLRNEIKKAELHAEQIEQAMLAHWLDRHAGAERPVENATLKEVLNTVISFFSTRTGRADAGSDETVQSSLHILLYAVADRA